MFTMIHKEIMSVRENINTIQGVSPEVVDSVNVMNRSFSATSEFVKRVTADVLAFVSMGGQGLGLLAADFVSLITTGHLQDMSGYFKEMTAGREGTGRTGHR